MNGFGRDCHGWLRDQLAQWRAEGLITSEQEIALRQRYPASETDWMEQAFSLLAVLTVSLGLMLLVAYNWDRLLVWSKLALAIGSVGLMHGIALKAPGLSPALREVLHLFGTLLFGVAIWVIAQVFHRESLWGEGFLLWGLGALAMAAVRSAVWHLWLAVAVLTLWAMIRMGAVPLMAPRLDVPLVFLLVAVVAGLHGRRWVLTFALVVMLWTLADALGWQTAAFWSVTDRQGLPALWAGVLSGGVLLGSTITVSGRQSVLQQALRLAGLISLVGIWLFTMGVPEFIQAALVGQLPTLWIGLSVIGLISTWGLWRWGRMSGWLAGVLMLHWAGLMSAIGLMLVVPVEEGIQLGPLETDLRRMLIWLASLILLAGGIMSVWWGGSSGGPGW